MLISIVINVCGKGKNVLLSDNRLSLMIYNPFIPLYNHKDCIPKVAFIWDNHTRSSEVLLSN